MPLDRRHRHREEYRPVFRHWQGVVLGQGSQPAIPDWTLPDILAPMQILGLPEDECVLIPCPRRCQRFYLKGTLLKSQPFLFDAAQCCLTAWPAAQEWALAYNNTTIERGMSNIEGINLENLRKK